MGRIAEGQGPCAQTVLLGIFVARQIVAPLQCVDNAKGRRRIELRFCSNFFKRHAAVALNEEVENVKAFFQ